MLTAEKARQELSRICTCEDGALQDVRVHGWGAPRLARRIAENLNDRSGAHDRAAAAVVAGAGRKLAEEVDALSDRERKKVFAALVPSLGTDLAFWWEWSKTRPLLASWGGQSMYRTSDVALQRSSRWSGLAALVRHATHYPQPIEWHATWLLYLSEYSPLGDLLASSMDAGNAAVRRILLESLAGTHAIAGPSRQGFIALLSAQDAPAWEVVFRDLVAAGREEGLRETIITSAAVGHPDALTRLCEIVADNDLARFSSTPRALSWWVGEELGVRRSAEVAEAFATIVRFRRQPPSAAQLRTAAPTEVFLALWSLVTQDASAAIALAAGLVQDPDMGRRLAVARVLAVIPHPDAVAPLAAVMVGADLPVFVAAMQAWMPGRADGQDTLRFPHGVRTELQQRLEGMPASQTVDIGVFAPRVEKVQKADLGDVLAAHSGGEEIDLAIASPNARYRAALRYAEDPERYRSQLLTLSLDSSRQVRWAASRGLDMEAITHEEALLLEQALTRTSDDLRRTALKLLSRQAPVDVAATVDRLRAGKAEQRRAAGDLADLHGLAQDSDPTAAADDSTTTGLLPNVEERPPLLRYGVEDRTSAVRPVAPPPSRWSAYHPGARHLWRSLGAWMDEHGNAEVHTPEGIKLLADIREIAPGRDGTMPLAELLGPWWERVKEGLVDGGVELVLLRLLHAGDDARARTVLGDLGGDTSALPRALRVNLLGHLAHREWRASWVEPVLDLLELEAAELPTDDLIGPRNIRFDDRREREGYDPREFLPIVNGSRDYLDPAALDDGQLARLWRTLRFLDEPEGAVDQWSGPRIEFGDPSRWGAVDLLVDQPFRYRPPLGVVIEAFERGIATRADLVDHVVSRPVLRCELHAPDLNPLARFSAITTGSPQLQAVVLDVQRTVVELELPRGDLPTPYSGMAMLLARATGAETLVAVLQALGRRPFTRTQLYHHRLHYTEEREGVFSHLVRIHHPAGDEMADSVAEAFAGTKIPETRIIETAMFAPQWAPLFEEHLGWPGLASAVWWVHAHTQIDGYGIASSLRAEREREIPRRTPVSDEDRANGCADVEWFARMHAELGDDRLDRVLKAAKYASVTGEQKQAELFANVLRGRTGEDELLLRMHEKRHQDAVRAYGLMPLSDDPEELLRRYEVLRGFVRTGKTSGAQRRAKETAAVHTALENLARAAGYRDPQRLTWAMEARTAADLGRGAVTAVDGDLTVSLSIDDLGMPVIEVDRAGKTLAAVPAKSRKVAEIAALTARARELKQQAQRMRASLEAACVLGDVIDAEELALLQAHPILGRMLPDLVMVDGEGRAGFLSAGGDELVLADDSTIRAVGGLRIAHPVDLLASGDWPDLQHVVMTRGRPQPFKQVFRELYVLNENEKDEQGVSSRRYVGYQLTSTRAAGLFISRGWVRDYGFGYGRTFHNEKITAFCNTSGGWGTAAEIEESVTDDVRFAHAGSFDAIPLSEVPPRVFSETMRDLDLVVSLAHASGVDPQSSESSIQLRQRIVEETCGLLGLRNVEIDGHHVRITGALGAYSVHLGSGIVHRIPGNTLFIIPVSAQHRGRVFLPFVDDDPRTAEIVSKVVMLASDDKIKDPTILRQLVL